MIKEKSIENVFEFLNGQDRVTCTISDDELIKTFKKVAKKYPDIVDIVYYSRKNGVLTCHVPVSAFSLNIDVIKAMAGKTTKK